MAVRRLSIKLATLVAVLFLCSLPTQTESVTAAVTPASEQFNADWRLTIQPNARPLEDWCRRDSTGNICGPIALVVRIRAYFSEDDLPLLTSSLHRGPETVPLRWGGSDSQLLFKNGAGIYANDAAYQSSRTEAYTINDLTPGLYRYDWRVDTSGRWECSVYYKNGCYFSEDDFEAKTYYFLWNGQPLVVYPARTATVRSGKILSAKKVISASNLADIPGVKAKALSSKSSVCKVNPTKTVGTITGLKKGTCKVKIRFTFEDGNTQVLTFKTTVRQ